MNKDYLDYLKLKNNFFDKLKSEYPELYNEFKKLKLNYYKGDILPFINFNCRKDMTTGDIDCIQWDFKLNKLRIIESKRENENQKNSQNELLLFFKKIFIYLNKNAKKYNFELFKMIGDSPYNKVQIINLLTNEIKNTNNEYLKEFLEFNLDFEDIKE